MSASVFLVKAAELEFLEQNRAKPEGMPENFEFKGFLLCPYVDDTTQPAMFLNPVFGLPDSQGNGDIIVQKNNVKACPYPPGYGS